MLKQMGQSGRKYNWREFDFHHLIDRIVPT